MVFASMALRKRAPSYALAVDAANIFRMVQLVRMALYRRIGNPSWGVDPRKKWRPAWLCELGVVK